MKNKKGKWIVTAIVIVMAAIGVARVVIPKVRRHVQNVSLGRQWATLLKKHPAFSARKPAYDVDVDFHYAAPMDEDLRKLRDMYDLEAVAGRGSETERIINLMHWVYRLTGHANEPEIPKVLNAFNLIRLAKVEHMQINCFMKTVILNEVYLAMGFASRQTHLLPHSNEEEESHFITSVYSPALRKWILMDPDFGVYVTDEKGAILGVAEIRSRLVAGRPMKVKTEGGSFLSNARDAVTNFIDGADYLWFLTDFIFKIQCPQDSLFNQLSKPNRVYFELIPDGYREELLREPRTTAKGNRIIAVNDEDLFWRKPALSSCP